MNREVYGLLLKAILECDDKPGETVHVDVGNDAVFNSAFNALRHVVMPLGLFATCWRNKGRVVFGNGATLQLRVVAVTLDTGDEEW